MLLTTLKETGDSGDVTGAGLIRNIRRFQAYSQGGGGQGPVRKEPNLALPSGGRGVGKWVDVGWFCWGWRGEWVRLVFFVFGVVAGTSRQVSEI